MRQLLKSGDSMHISTIKKSAQHHYHNYQLRLYFQANISLSQSQHWMSCQWYQKNADWSLSKWVRCLYAAKCNSYNLLWPTNWYVAYLQYLLDVFIANVNVSQIYIVQNHEASSIRAPYRLWGCNAPGFICWFCYCINCLLTLILRCI